MNKSSTVEVVNYFTIYKTPYKYAHKEVLICISVLFYQSKSLSVLHFSVVSSNDFNKEIQRIVDEAFNWIYGSLKSNKFELRQSFIFDISDEVAEALKLAITRYTNINNIQKSYSIRYTLQVVNFDQEFSEIKDIFSFDTTLSLAIAFNLFGFYNFSLKNQAIVKLKENNFLSLNPLNV